MEWISVKDRLPEIGEPVIIYYGRFVAEAMRNDNGVFVVSCSDEEAEDVTHWMPLPEPPKE